MFPDLFRDDLSTRIKYCIVASFFVQKDFLSIAPDNIKTKNGLTKEKLKLLYL